MSYGNIKKRTQEAAQPVETIRQGCYASNCPCRGSISQEGGHFLCSAHAFIPADRWPGVTEKLRNHDWLIAFIDDIQRMDRMSEDWRRFAVQFWTNQDEACLPDVEEQAIPYQNRMRGELLYRCGLLKRPAVRLPQPITSRGNAADSLSRRAA